MAQFKTRARALDMLGRQQIAGVPNSINELFKNAHDAYATHMTADYFRSSRILILRDNGIGMSESEFENNWLTLGTESKLNERKYIPKGRAERIVMGEKGIGRLSIAALGKQVVVLTRANRGDLLDDLVCSYIHWDIFGCPGINLSEIEIPIKTFTSGYLPSSKDIDNILIEFQESISTLSKKNNGATGSIIKKINRDIEQALGSISPDKYSKGNLKLHDGGTGTHFYIFPTDESLDASIDET